MELRKNALRVTLAALLTLPLTFAQAQIHGGGGSGGGVSSVTGAGATTCSPTTGAVTCTTTAGAGSANPSATIGTAAINGTASTFMTSDSAPAAPAATNATLGLMKGDGAGITCTAGTCGLVNTLVQSISNGTGWSCTTGCQSNTEGNLTSVTIPALGANSCITIDTLWEYTNGANTKTLSVRWFSLAGGATSGAQYLGITQTSTATSRNQTKICNLNATNSQKGGVANAVSFGSSASGTVTGSLQTNTPTTLYFNAKDSSTGDTITLDWYSIQINP